MFSSILSSQCLLVVAQICNLPYRRIAFGQVWNGEGLWIVLKRRQNDAPRFVPTRSRLKTCDAVEGIRTDFEGLVFGSADSQSAVPPNCIRPGMERRGALDCIEASIK
jgi:hypothetical protein